MFGKILVVLGCIYQGFVAGASSFIVESYQSEPDVTQLRYVDSESKMPVTLTDVLHEYGYEEAVLPQNPDALAPYLKMYSWSNEYVLLCDSKFLAPIKSTFWTIKFSLISSATYPTETIDRLKNFCTLIRPEGESIDFKNFLIKVLFEQNGLYDLYSEIKGYEKNFRKDLFSGKLCSDFNTMLDTVDQDEKIDRFKKKI